MELKEFIAKTLVEIQEGVQNAIFEVKEKNTKGAINPVFKTIEGFNSKHIREVNFDIAVTVSEKNDGNMGGGIKVMGIGINSNLSESSQKSHVSRIQFSIPVIPPVTEVE